jgi:primase-polymerase (primpol)-like protein
MGTSNTSALCAENFPLKDGERFVVWTYEDRGGKPTKVPKIATTRGVFGASHSDPSTWRSWEAALEAYATGRFDGIGRMFAEEDGIIGVDFDGVRSLETGAIDQDTLDWLAILNSYAEISPSLLGVKVWVRGQLPRSYRKPGLEVYRSTRFFTITGQRLPEYSAGVEERQEELEALVSWHFPAPKRAEVSQRGPRDGQKLDLSSFITEAGVEVLSEMFDGTADIKYGIVCPWVDEHTGGDESGTRVGQYEDGALFFHCEHSHCAGRKWADFRDKVSPRIPGWSRRPKIYISGKLVAPNV